jgi:glycerol-3-phosphate acyltransferase PlsY
MISSKDIFAILISYAIGCVSSGYYLTLFFGRKDIRTCGSGSTGARNVGRILGRWGFAATFILDIARGILAAWIAKSLGVQSWAMMVSLLALAAGHIWPVQLKFRGGRGIVVVLGFLLFFDYRIIVWAAVVFVIALIISRRYEISVFAGILATPFTAFFTGHSIIEVFVIAITAVVIIAAHREYIRKFLKQPEEIIS